ncbi:hypothetical protein CBOM_07809 [Ceraceosorus bombacis]|uniref:Uncharacterized protein n=1 Tax=Ceraceosorus bombacis TaxID=401625 RepID=A0A0P1BB80_9BASI|nr:hypothetical protein CBOM_07809 [Ceraceosorus bombacis]
MSYIDAPAYPLLCAVSRCRGGVGGVDRRLMVILLMQTGAQHDRQHLLHQRHVCASRQTSACCCWTSINVREHVCG